MNEVPRVKKRFIWVASTPSGKQHEGEFFATQKQDVVMYLESRNYKIEKIQQQYEFLREFRRKELKQKQIFAFLSQVSAIMSTGLPLVEALRVIKESEKKQALKELARDIIRDIDSGKPFSVALSRYPKLFPPLVIRLIAAGEESSELAAVLKQVVKGIEELNKTKGHQRTAKHSQ